MKYINTFFDKFKKDNYVDKNINPSEEKLYFEISYLDYVNFYTDHKEKGLNKSYLEHLNNFIKKDWIYTSFTSKLEKVDKKDRKVYELPYFISIDNCKLIDIDSASSHYTIRLFEDDWYLVNIYLYLSNSKGRKTFVCYYKCDTMEGVEQLISKRYDVQKKH